MVDLTCPECGHDEAFHAENGCVKQVPEDCGCEKSYEEVAS